MICSDQNSYKDEKEGQVTNSNYYSYDALAPDATAKDVLLPLMLRGRSEQSRMLDALHSEKRMLFTKHPIFSRSSLELASNQGNQPARLYIEHVSSSQSVTRRGSLIPVGVLQERDQNQQAERKGSSNTRCN